MTTPPTASSEAERLRTLLSKLINCIEEDINHLLAKPVNRGEGENSSLNHQHLWGQKETAISLLLKLSALFARMHPTEKFSEEEKQTPEDTSLTPEEKAIMERYYSKFSGEPYQGMPEEENHC
ncbi:MAG: hypothetical protein K0R63_952 [Rickettsiales bacterium]|jgi:hypothetical protein|nr:hypothetical protein [Rickettsiales bacterium]